MKVYNNLMEMHGDVEEIIYEEMKAVMLNAYDEYSNNAADYMDIDFVDTLGGKVYFIENVEDLKEIYAPILETKPDGTSYNIIERPAMFDTAGYLPGKQYAVLFCAVNNSGGDTYYIPRKVFSVVSCVAECIKLTHKYENNINDNFEVSWSNDRKKYVYNEEIDSNRN